MEFNVGDTDRRPPPIFCHDCGEVCADRGEIFARRMGWEGFSTVRMADGYERLGMCPACQKAPNALKGAE